MTLTLLVLAAISAVADWYAVWRRRVTWEHGLKPLTLVLLIAAAASAHLGDAKPWVIVALALGLLGDIGLMLSDDAAAEPDLPFLLGLGAFLLGHVAYLIAFVRHGVHAGWIIAGLVLALALATPSIVPVLTGARRDAGTPLASVVAVYAALLTAMATLAVGTARAATGIGGLLFLTSDILIARDKFLPSDPATPRSTRVPVLIMVTYHLAQGLILIGLITRF